MHACNMISKIDGKGILKLNSIISIPVIFECKRYKDSVSSVKIRNFRGAMEGRADKGIFITTGDFTRDAKKEATREGTKIIDLVNGEKLVEMLNELGLGTKTKTVEKVIVDRNWFEKFR